MQRWVVESRHEGDDMGLPLDSPQQTFAGRPFVIAASIAYALFLALNSFSLWGFSSVTTAVLGEESPLWSSSYLLSNIASFFVAAVVGMLSGGSRSPRRVRRIAFCSPPSCYAWDSFY